jgi:putative FmdB family regulatory protein
MPIYEYECDECTRRFERLVLPSRPQSDEDRACPACKGSRIRQVPSLFAVDSASTRQMNKGHGRKLAQKDITEQKHADMEHVIHHHREGANHEH